MEFESCLAAPPEWHKVSVASVCRKFTSGGTPSRKKPEYFEGGVIPWIKTKELADCVLDDAEEWITEAAIASSSAKRLPRNTLLMAMYGATVGQLGVLGREMACNQACAAMVVDDTLCDFRFLYYQLLGNRRQIVSMATGAAQQNLSGAQIKTWVLPIPSREEQDRICHLLWSIDERIALLRKTNATLEAIGQALFKSWFVDFDPVHAKAEGREPEKMDAATAALFPSKFVESELGLVPMGWQVLSLGDAFVEKSERVGNRKIPEYSSTNSGLRPRSTQFKKNLSASISNNKVVREGDFVFGLSRKVLNFGLMFEQIGCVSPVYKVFSVRNDVPVPPRYLERLIRLKAQYFYGAVSASSREGQSVSSNGLRSLKLVCPDLQILDRFAEIADELSARVATGCAQIESLEAIRDTLLPRLISGKLRLPEAEATLEATP